MKSAIVIAALLFAPLFAQAGDLQISVLRKKGEAEQTTRVSEGETFKGKENYFYEVSVSNKSFKPSHALEARYILFVERQEMGQKIGSERVEKVKGTAKVAALDAHANTHFDTKTVSLRERGLVGAYYYANGGRIKAKDSLTGVWIKLFDGNTEVAEYVNPTSLTSKQKWE